MRWIIAIAVMVAAVWIMTSAKDKRGASPERMAKVRAAKKRKAIQRQKITYTPPAKSEGGMMKVA